MITRYSFGVLVVAVLAAGCTSPNPRFAGAGGDGPLVGDGGGGDLIGGDGAGAVDGSLTETGLPPEGGIVVVDGNVFDGAPPSDGPPPPPDLGPPPDCVKDSDCVDGLTCTADTCAGGKCSNPLEEGACLIDGACETAGPHPAQPCKRCAPKQSTTTWVNVADGQSCADDGVACTADVCKAGVCTHALGPDWCLIGSSCVPAGQTDDGGCQVCEPGVTQTGWSKVADGKKCALDGKWCTDDVCQAGACAHLVIADTCLVGGVCRDAGQTGGTCLECIPDQSQTDYTFVAGKPCTTSISLLGSMCIAQQCRPFVESQVAAPQVDQLATSLAGVAVVPVGSKKQVWAAGGFRVESTEGEVKSGGLLVRLDKPDSLLTPTAFRGIHHRMAVAGKGMVYEHAGNGWVEAAQISGQLAGDRFAVWGASLGGQVDVHYLVGGVDPPGSHGVYRCEALFGNVVCASNYTGFTDGAELTGVYGSLGANGTQGPVWAINGDGPDDIYHNSGASLSWSQGVAEGCQDLGSGGSTPCSSSDGDLTDIYASSASDVWVVGDNDIVLSFDGKKWTRHWGSIQLANHTITAVYSNPAEDLVSFVGHRDTNQGRWVVMFNYNRKLDRWLPPVQLKFFVGYDSGARIADIAGSGYTDLWLVGQASDLLSGSALTQGWVLHLQ